MYSGSLQTESPFLTPQTGDEILKEKQSKNMLLYFSLRVIPVCNTVRGDKLKIDKL
jgi:hypothetical protein